MTGAHLGGHGAGRRRSCSATAAPRESAGRRGHADGRHHPRSRSAAFFHQILIDVYEALSVTKTMLMDNVMDHPHRF